VDDVVKLKPRSILCPGRDNCIVTAECSAVIRWLLRGTSMMVLWMINCHLHMFCALQNDWPNYGNSLSHIFYSVTSQ
jgi:hypothetical protein